MLNSASTRRLPGIAFESAPRAPADILPRMDIPVFVGFAAAGPLHTPVAVEDPTQFELVFGPDLALAWDQSRGEILNAYLAPAVRAFFRNGGQRCWIVRVARDPEIGEFVIPGLISLDGNAARPAVARARSGGTWCDALRLGAALTSTSLTFERLTQTHPPVVDLGMQIPDLLGAGDLVSVTFPASGHVVYFTVGSHEPVEPGSLAVHASQHPTSVRATGQDDAWFTLGAPPHARFDAPTATLFSGRAERAGLAVLNPLSEWATPGADGLRSIELALPFGHAPEPGTMLCIWAGAAELWLTIRDVGGPIADAASSPLAAGVRIVATGLWRVAAPALAFLAVDRGAYAQRLALELHVRVGADQVARLGELGFHPSHPRYWGTLPSDDALYKDTSAFRRPEPLPPLWSAAASPRFPLAGPLTAAPSYPIGIDLDPGPFVRPATSTSSTARRNGLEVFSLGDFVENDLAPLGILDLLSEADFLRYELPTPRHLAGIHAALCVEEATLVAVPDAVHRGWVLGEEAPLSAPRPSPPVAHPEWWHFLDCDPPAAVPIEPEPHWDEFLDCDLQLPHAPPQLEADEPDETGSFSLSWSVVPGGRYVLEESMNPDFQGAATIFEGSDRRLSLYGRQHGDYYYRVCASVACVSTDWSTGIVVRVAAATLLWLVQPEEDYFDEPLLGLHRALLRMSAARGDLMAILALPEHYREEASLSYLQALTSPRVASRIGALYIPPIAEGEAKAFSYGAAYHPWLIERQEQAAGRSPDKVPLRRLPPDGAACGLIARRTLSRGAWIAPANEPFRGVVGLTPAIDQRRRLELQNAQLNLVRQEPHGFVVLNADTLSPEADLRPIGTRRLLSLVRRLALRLGATYVFESHDDAFQRRVHRGFDAALRSMFVRGAFGGSTPDSSYQVITDAAVNPAPSVEQGRFVVELRVAPSLPLTFVTIRMVHTHSGVSVAEGA
jgi:hypothetical protein